MTLQRWYRCVQLPLSAKTNAPGIGDADLLMLAPVRGLALITPAQAIDQPSA
jgi:hypothetical protein